MPEHAPTPGQTVGPFFHDALPYADGPALAAPGTLRLHGTVYDGAGEPVPDALVEIRQADASGEVPRAEGSLHRGEAFTGWGRAATDADGRYAFDTVEPTGEGAPFFAVVVFARGLLDRLFTRAYVPGAAADADPWLSGVEESRRGTLLATRDDDGSLRFDIRLQGDHETVFLAFPQDG